MKKIVLPLFLSALLLGGGCSSDSSVDQPVVPESPVVESEEQPEDPDFSISIDEAEADLMSLLNDLNFQGPATRSGGPRRIAERYSLGIPTGTRAEVSDSLKPYIHIFNFEDEEGFAIMSADERVASMLTLTYGGSLRPDEEIDNPGLAMFLERLPVYYEQQIALADSLRIAEEQAFPTNESATRATFNRYSYGAWKNIETEPVMGYCVTRWYQQSPLNQYVDGEYVGCTPVALGQLMTMFKHPASYNDYTFDWNQMAQRSFTTTSTEKVARLLQQLSIPQNLNVDYSRPDGGGGTNAENIKKVLDNFGYTCTDLSTYNTSTVVRELTAGYPCVVGGYSKKTETKILGITVNTSFGGGHRWLVHGLMTRSRTVTEYKDPNGVYPTVRVLPPPGSNIYRTYTETQGPYLLCNMGWGGYQDGYYMGGVFNANSGPIYPSPTRDNVERYYQHELTMITGIRKK